MSSPLSWEIGRPLWAKTDIFARHLHTSCFRSGLRVLKELVITSCLFTSTLTLTPDEITIDVLRGLQGIGGAAIIPSAIGIMAEAFPSSRLRAVAFSTFGAGAPVGASIGNLIGGVFTELTS